MNEVGVQYNDSDIDEDEFAQDRSPQTGIPRFNQIANSKNTSRKVAARGSKPTTDEKGLSRKDDPSRSTRSKSTTDEKGASVSCQWRQHKESKSKTDTAAEISTTKRKKLKSKRNTVRHNPYVILMLFPSSQ